MLTVNRIANTAATKICNNGRNKKNYGGSRNHQDRYLELQQTDVIF
jgi:hypothetical protein